MSTNASAYDISVSNADGMTIYYNYTNDGKELSVTYNGSSYEYEPHVKRYEGHIVIPEEVIYMGRKRRVTSIGSNAFNSCHGLNSITIPNSVTAIGEHAFSACSGLTSVNIPNSVTAIGAYAFSGCNGLTFVTIPNGVTSIGKGAFSGCTCLTGISVASGNIVYDSRENCNAIIETASNTLVVGCSNTNILNNVTAVGEYAFLNCTGLTSVNIPNSVTVIGEHAFTGCRSLTSVNIPNSVTAIGAHAFSACDLTSVNIPNSVITIGEGSFYNCLRLKEINISNGVKNIDKMAFYGCGGLTSVTIPNSVINLGNGVFHGCSGMTSVTISNSVIRIGEEAFSDCRSLLSVTIPNSVTSIGHYAFKDCRGLTSIVSLIENPFKFNGKTLNLTPFPLDVFNNATLYVPVGTIDKYKNTEGWKDFVFIEEGTGGITPEPISKPQKCEKPTISYQNGKLIFISNTEGAICQYSITDSDIKSGKGNEVELAATYNISVYATKAGCENSEVATATLCWLDFSPKMEGVVNGVAKVNTKVFLIKNDGGNLIIEGTDDGEQVSVYTTNGMQVGNDVIFNGTAKICTNLQKGNIAVVKVGEKSVKVMVK